MWINDWQHLFKRNPLTTKIESLKFALRWGPWYILTKTPILGWNIFQYSSVSNGYLAKPSLQCKIIMYFSIWCKFVIRIYFLELFLIIQYSFLTVVLSVVNWAIYQFHESDTLFALKDTTNKWQLRRNYKIIWPDRYLIT